jgi:hypothetical protein
MRPQDEWTQLPEGMVHKLTTAYLACASLRVAKEEVPIQTDHRVTIGYLSGQS